MNRASRRCPAAAKRLSAQRVRPCKAARWRLFCRTHELEGFDNLFAVRVLVNLAGGPVGEFVPALCRNRIAEHQRINDPDGSRLHCLECPLSQMDRPDKDAMPLVATMLVSRGLRASVHAARVHRKVTLYTGELPH